ncbi:hypothetical protein EMIHUDRAFT_228600 [Emiliania huxleyi CCMP1516]|uniref:Uncharacterized protein n=2 Tax=Emiliania huxleyi TaxID=2903 RepID=A0A0D3KF94_EMIH1|nr:hypothetical protein EMIHUDRAFT_228600 [Emiliania huxleyi CCMP1516]EOD34429.1 hypothetical protein EMIHUDRAFT_228600 [Emiliania huxleyi CCMP1516]|eukprot:XP_005786858.1 hypothetical protein EMIHUDRAFT_228600 [Emiliania huxleyi CCMP1516]
MGGLREGWIEKNIRTKKRRREEPAEDAGRFRIPVCFAAVGVSPFFGSGSRLGSAGVVLDLLRIFATIQLFVPSEAETLHAFLYLATFGVAGALITALAALVTNKAVQAKLEAGAGGPGVTGAVTDQQQQNRVGAGPQ